MAKEFLGKGWKFPVEVDPATGRILMSEHEDDVAEAIRIILQTSQGERMMRGNFGCDLRDFNFEMTDDTTLKMLESNILKAIRNWEPRVDEVDVRAEADASIPGKLHIHIQYTVRNTNNLYNQVFPFYLFEGAS
ncbi:GPW/gp25 family protein [Marinicrinis sediminis]|uniref:GPW/gp25 family protein n=1 Tax=Marinicrinis sediminis TaxID=1652465 RepID=A0ABW5RDN3_9BACL